MEYIDYELECIAFDLIRKLTQAQEKRNIILARHGKVYSDKEQEALGDLNDEISLALEKLKQIYSFH